jgi:hypothetical protein
MRNQTFDMSNFDYTDDFIILQPETVFYRGIKNCKKNKLKESEIIRDKPMYLGSKEIAKMYGDVYCLCTSTSLRLLDLRKIMTILTYVLDYTDDYYGNLLLTIAYGLVPYNLQLQMFKKFNDDMISQGKVPTKNINDLNEVMEHMKNFKFENIPTNPLIKRGVRIGEPYIDMQCLLILKHMFKDICDGYIAPILDSPYHINNKAHEEIVLFNPKDCLFIINDIDIEIQPISDRIHTRDQSVIITPKLKIFIPKTAESSPLASGNANYVDKNKIFDKKKLYKKTNLYAQKYVNSLKVLVSSPRRNIKIRMPFYDIS